MNGIESKKEYIHRVNRVIDYIERNLDSELHLHKLAEVANFSAFHFHRIFSVITGETLNQFIRRIKIEKAASLLVGNPDIPVSEISERLGFSSASVFCRNFREHFHVSASEYRRTRPEELSKIRQSISKIHQSTVSDMKYFRSGTNNKNRSNMKNSQIEIREQPAYQLIYCRHTGRFDQIRHAYEKLFRFAMPRGLVQPDSKTMTVYHDDPGVTSVDKVRQSACLVVDQEVKTEGEIGKMTIKGGKYAVGHFEITVHEFEMAWNNMCEWMTGSGYLPGEGYPYELYHQDPETHPENKFVLDICIPVQAMN